MRKLTIVISILLILAIILCACSAEDLATRIADKVVPEDKKPAPHEDKKEESQENQEENGDESGDEDGDEDDDEDGENVPQKIIEDKTDYGEQHPSITKDQFYAALDYDTNFLDFTITNITTIQSPGIENIDRVSNKQVFIFNENAFIHYREEDGNLIADEYYLIKNGYLYSYQLTYADDSDELVWKEENEPSEIEETNLKYLIPTTVGSLIDSANYIDDPEYGYKYEDFRYNENADLYTTNKSSYASGESDVLLQLAFNEGKLVYANELKVSLWEGDINTEIMYFQNEYAVTYGHQDIVIPDELAALIP